jgi:hypothetical protein
MDKGLLYTEHYGQRSSKLVLPLSFMELQPMEPWKIMSLFES